MNGQTPLQESARRSVWCVWTESGEYENWSRDLAGIFPSEALAEAHAAQVRELDKPDVCEVLPEPVLPEIPGRVPYIEWSAHITPDGAEDPGLGFHRGTLFETWSNQITAARGRIGPWSARRVPDLFIEVIGCDAAAVEAEYTRLLAEARKRLSEGASGG